MCGSVYWLLGTTKAPHPIQATPIQGPGFLSWEGRDLCAEFPKKALDHPWLMQGLGVRGSGEVGQQLPEVKCLNLREKKKKSQFFQF